MRDASDILNLQYFKRDSYISVICQASFMVEDRKADAVTHLAIARSQNTENGILGVKNNTKDKGSCESNCSFFDYKFSHANGKRVLVSY